MRSLKVRAGTLTFSLRMTQSLCGKFRAVAYHDLAVAAMAKTNEGGWGKDRNHFNPEERENVRNRGDCVQHVF